MRLKSNCLEEMFEGGYAKLRRYLEEYMLVSLKSEVLTKDKMA